MNVLLKLFLTFAKLYPTSFGGGFVMLAGMQDEFTQNKLIEMSELTDIIAIASMCPGSVAINAALGVGYSIAGVPGAIAAFMGITVPTVIIVLLVASFFFKIYKHPKVKAAFYGLRPVITGIIIYAGTKYALSNGMILAKKDQMITSGKYISFANINAVEIYSFLIIIVALFILLKTKIHPIALIIASAVLGLFIF